MVRVDNMLTLDETLICNIIRVKRFEALLTFYKPVNGSSILSSGDPKKRFTKEDVTPRKAETVLNGQGKRFIVWTCATAKYNLRLLMMRSHHPNMRN